MSTNCIMCRMPMPLKLDHSNVCDSCELENEIIMLEEVIEDDNRMMYRDDYSPPTIADLHMIKL